MEGEMREERRRTAGGSEEERRENRGRRRDRIIIQLPEIDPALCDLVTEMLPGRALMRVLRDLPDDLILHTRNARRERLLAMRSLIDALIEETERPVARRRAREVEIE